MASDDTTTKPASTYDFITGEDTVSAKMDTLRDVIRRIPLFRDESQQHLDVIGRLATQTQVGADEVLVRQDQEGNDLIMLLDGSARVERNGKVIAHMGPGDFIGEMSLLDGKPRSATVITDEPSTIIVIQKHTFDHLLENNQEIHKRIIVTLCSRIRESHENLID